MPEDGLPTIMDQKSCTLRTGEPWEYGASKLWDGTLGDSRHSMAALPMVTTSALSPIPSEADHQPQSRDHWCGQGPEPQSSGSELWALSNIAAGV